MRGGLQNGKIADRKLFVPGTQIQPVLSLWDHSKLHGDGRATKREAGRQVKFDRYKKGTRFFFTYTKAGLGGGAKRFHPFEGGGGGGGDFHPLLRNKGDWVQIILDLLFSHFWKYLVRRKLCEIAGIW